MTSTRTRPSSTDKPAPPIVHKFGGAALADAAGLDRAVQIVSSFNGFPNVVVASAMAGTTDALVTAAMHAAAGEAERIAGDVRELRERHVAAAQALGLGRAGAWINPVFDRLETTLRQVRVAARLDPAVSDELLAYGERISARLLAAAFEASGVRVALVDAASVIQTDGRPGNAAPVLTATEVRARDLIVPVLNAGQIAIVPGFIGGSEDGGVVTLGRGGSDLSATVLARVLGAPDVYLWKNVPGFLTADPRVVPNARVVAHLSAREAAELAYYGAKVLHPRALTPLDGNIRVHVRPFDAPTARGTEISIRASSGGSPVRALSAIRNQALVTVSGNGMIDVPGIAATTFGALGRAGISVSLITQASSEHSICLSVRNVDADAARACLTRAFAQELERREIDRVDVQRDVATLAVVGAGMAHTPGIAARVFSALAAESVNIIAIAQGSSEINISVVVDEDRADDAQRAIHAAFQLDKRAGGRVKRAERADIVLMGFGRIGRELVSHAAHSDIRARLRIVGIIDRGGYLFDDRGLSDRKLALAAHVKRRGGSVAAVPGGATGNALGEIGAHALTRPILVDVTSADTHRELMAAVEHGMDVVLANKVPLTIAHERTSAFLDLAKKLGRRVLFEATVGAGLPIIDTFEKLAASGDKVLTIEGCPSGTLGYVLGELGRGTPFSVAVGNAMSAGYTEPDPRDDLSGLDVARKGLILARLLGFKGELSDVAIESLVPESLRDVRVGEFLERMAELNAMWAERVETARAKGEVLRYRTTATRGSVRVGLVSVPMASALGSLVGTDNQFVFTTKRYRENPLVIIGPGAGPAVTAQGVMNDILKLAESRSRS